LAKKAGRPKKGTGLQITRVITELKSGKTTKQVAEQMGVTTRAIEFCCKRHGFSLKTLEGFKAHKADLLAWKQQQIVSAMTPEKIKESSLRDQASTFNVLQNAERLERGQATSNVNINALNDNITEIDAQIAQLEKQLKEKGETEEAEFTPPEGT